MGKIVAEMASAAKTQVPTSDQLRIAQILNGNKSLDNDLMQEKIRKILELTRCDENAASYALHDCCYDVDEAVDKILEGKFSSEGEWTIQEGKKSKKIINAGDDLCEENFYDEPSTEFFHPKNKSNERNNFQHFRGRGGGIRRGAASKNDENEFQSTLNSSRGGRRRGRGRARGNGSSRDIESKNTNRDNWSRSKDSNWINNTAENVRPTIGEWSNGGAASSNHKTKFLESQTKASDVDSKFLSVNLDVSDWGGEEDWKNIPKEFRNSSANRGTNPTPSYVAPMTNANFSATNNGLKNEPKNLRQEIPVASATAVPSTSATIFTKPEFRDQITMPSRSSQPSAATKNLSQNSSLKVSMPLNSTPYGQIDVEFGEFGPVKSIGVDPSRIFDFASSPDYSSINANSAVKQNQNIIPSTTTAIGQDMNSFLSVNHSLMNDVLSSAYKNPSSSEFRQSSPFVVGQSRSNEIFSTDLISDSDKESALNKSKVSFSQGHGLSSGINYSRNNADIRVPASKIQSSTSGTTLFNSAPANQTSQASSTAGLPYIYGAADQSSYLNAALNAYGIISPQGNSYSIPFNAYDLNALRQLPPILNNKFDASSNFRDHQVYSGSNESKPQTSHAESRTGANNSSSYGLSNANQQVVAQLAAAFQQYQYPFYAAPFMVPPSVGSQTTNNTGQFNKPNVHPSTLFYGNNNDSRFQYDFSKQSYGGGNQQQIYAAGVVGANSNQMKSTSNVVNYNNLPNVDTNAKSFASLKQFTDVKQPANPNLSPLGASSNVGYHPSASTYGNYTNYPLAQHQMMANFLSQQSFSNEGQRLNNIGGGNGISSYNVSAPKTAMPNQFSWD